MNELEEAILKQMEENEGAETEDENLTPSESENISQGKQPELELKTLTKKGVALVLDQIVGVRFRMGEAIFEIKSINKGKCRFTAEVANPIEECNQTIDYIGQARSTGTSKKK